MPAASKVGRGRGQRPTPAVDANFLGNLFKLSVAKIVKQILSSPILGVLKTLGHDAGSGEMPEINAFVVVTADKQVEQPIAVVIKPDGGVGIDPARQAGLLADTGEATASVVVVQLRASPLDQEEIFVAVIVIVAPDRAGRDSRARLVDIRNAKFGGHIFECAVAQVSVQGVFTSDGAVDDVNIRPAVAIEIDNGR